MIAQSKIVFEVEVDENKVPLNIKWQASEQDHGGSSATLISIWDAAEQNTLKLDLWTKDMKVDEMNLFFYQTLISMSETFKKATLNEALAKDLKDFSNYFGEKLGVVSFKD